MLKGVWYESVREEGRRQSRYVVRLAPMEATALPALPRHELVTNPRPSAR